MPKKTKKEKLLAAYRKKLHLLEQANKPAPSITSEVSTRTNLRQTSEVKQTEPEPLPKYFFIDLKKSLILIFIIIAIEIGLYFARLIK